MGRRNRVLDGDPPPPRGKGPGTFGGHAWLFRDLSAVDILSIVRKGAAVMRRLAAGACVSVAVCVCRLQPLYAADPREHPLLSSDERRTPGHEGMCENMSQIKSIKSNMTLIMVDKPQPSYNLLNVMK